MPDTYNDLTHVSDNDWVTAAEETIKIIAGCDDYIVLAAKKESDDSFTYSNYTTNALIAPAFLLYFNTLIDRMFDERHYNSK